ncbi:uncharacterized protein LOC119081081 [Bradysia coprophila]|uniref:uncharacterized protein LOC119081081 n=1 Tax=Bradysia coprophila TaxID=38358 RepID=UPI00187D8AA5|nr:uncharacterized protein LOC119081081 [Bradysia coprophila]
MVDGCCKRNHPGVKDLMPLNGSYEEKFILNRVGISNGDLILCLRIARVNHDCKPNADHRYDETFKAVVLFAQRDIAKGEEITICYQQFHDIAGNMSASTSRSALQDKWSIVCPEDCFCYDTQMQTLIARSRELDGRIYSVARQGYSQQALELVNELMGCHEILGSSFLNKERTLNDGFQIALKSKDTVAARKYIEGLYAISSATLSPESLEVIDLKQKKRLL